MRFSAVIMSVVLSGVTSLFGAVLESDWCRMETPDRVGPGEKFSVKLELKKDIPSGMKIGGDIHLKKQTGEYLGFGSWGGDPKPAEPGEKMIFHYRMPEMKNGSDAVVIQYFLSSKDWDNRVKEAVSPEIKVESKEKTKVPADVDGKKVMDTDWCRIEIPESVKLKGNFSVKLQLKKDIPPGMKVGGDLHLQKQTGEYLGFGSWGGDPKPAKPGQEIVFHYRMPEMKNGSDMVIIHYFLSPKGWDERVKEAVSPGIKVEGVNPPRPASATLKKSWISAGKIERADGKSLKTNPLKSGDEFILPVTYYVDPEDDWGKTELSFSMLGPWIDCPDGVYSRRRQHNGYPVHIPPIHCKIGTVARENIKIRVPEAFSAQPPEKGVLGDSMLLILQFCGNDGRLWPWQTRVEAGSFQRRDGYFELDSTAPGNLFTYSSPVEMYVIYGTKAVDAGTGKKLRWQVFHPDGRELISGEMPVDISGKRQLIPVKLPPEQRGTFRLRVSVPGWETRETTFARIPDLKAVTGGKPTPFGGQKFAGNSEAVAAAEMLGMSFCRTWVKWSSVQPGKNVWNNGYLNGLIEAVDEMNEHGIRPWIVLHDPPAWAIDKPDGWSADYIPFPFRDEQLKAVVHRLATALKGKISGFEWLNEICPGDLCVNPVEDYIRFCRIATRTARAIDPSFEIQAAGGLWPNSYRKSLLAGGLASYIDLLPVHYSDFNGVQMAYSDLKNNGTNIPVLDNETGVGIATWGMPLEKAIQDKTQSDYFYTRFPAELLAGCRKITLFAGEPDPAGNWTIFWGDMSPRPSAAALAVLVSKLWNARLAGEFSLGKRDSVKLFETPEKRAVMIVSSREKGGEEILLPAGPGNLMITDQQGNETILPEKPVHKLKVNSSPYIVEGGSLNVLKAQLMVTPAVSSLSFVKGHDAELPVRIANLADIPLSCEIELLDAPGKAKPIEINELEPGNTIQERFYFKADKTGSFMPVIRITYRMPGFPVVKKILQVNVIQPEAVGNLLKNPGFESARDKNEKLPLFWNLSPAKSGERFRFQSPDEPGHGDWVFRFQGDGKQYVSLYQDPKGPFVPGKYLYSLWIKSDNLQSGSNFSFVTADKRSVTRHWLEIFQAPVTQKYWDIFSAVVDIPEKTERISCTPLCFGKGWSMIDNAILTPYEGTEYVAFAPKSKKIRIDGNLDDFDRSAPIPLLGRSQLKKWSGEYDWSPDKFSGAAYFNWDEQNLYVGIEVIDREHRTGTAEAGCVSGDSVEIGIHPQNRLPGEEGKAFLFQVSSVAPGGSGKHTIYRPEKFSGGLKPGSLAKDSSIYDISVRREGNKTCYEIAMPWSDLGGIQGEFGRKIGLSLSLNDGDGRRKQASMLWGRGLPPAWDPGAFGMLVLVENSRR